ncbi:hypothetical protein CPB83DRAFT_915335 [Crepidotus variabilis]|uniref:Uncharacterized protein n=1 Tax=Crepidotus variabilis TaxID=179855 RepID=A0A9P6JJ65_9AGAR|nr:hypothetical protein CPB83DRAFT_915335 [Crepidotus variabilis]
MIAGDWEVDEDMKGVSKDRRKPRHNGRQEETGHDGKVCAGITKSVRLLAAITTRLTFVEPPRPPHLLREPLPPYQRHSFALSAILANALETAISFNLTKSSLSMRCIGGTRLLLRGGIECRGIRCPALDWVARKTQTDNRCDLGTGRSLWRRGVGNVVF